MEAFLIKIFFHPITLIILGILAILDTEIPWKIKMFFQKLKLKRDCYHLNKITNFLRIAYSPSFIRPQTFALYYSGWKDEYLNKLIEANILLPSPHSHEYYIINRDIL